MLNFITGIKGTPKLITCGQIEGCSLIVLTLCGPNIENQLKYYGGNFFITTVLMIRD